MSNDLKRTKPSADDEAGSSLNDSDSIMMEKCRDTGVKNKSKKLFNPIAVTWMEKYSERMEKMWNRLPNFVGSAVATCAIFLLGATMRGEWLIIVVHFAKQLGYGVTDQSDEQDSDSESIDWSKISLKSFYLQNLSWFWLSASCVSYGMYYGIGGFLHWYFYVRQRDKPEEWKCQPQKWITPELERHEIICGTFSLLLTSTLTSALACYLCNGGPSMVYYKFDQFSWTWWFLSWPAIYIYLDYTTYWLHRIYHTPWLYKHFHKLHHTYKQPTAFSVTAIHPVEILHIQSMLMLPLFLVPIHWVCGFLLFPFGRRLRIVFTPRLGDSEVGVALQAQACLWLPLYTSQWTVFSIKNRLIVTLNYVIPVPYCTIVIYNYYHGILDHSGINFKAHWWQPWQPDAIFHDNHHQYFHVNFGFNCFIWDKIHGTYRQKDRIYTEDTYYGKGKLISEATSAEIDADIEERDSENPLAYRSNDLPYKISKQDIGPIKSE